MQRDFRFSLLFKMHVVDNKNQAKNRNLVTINIRDNAILDCRTDKHVPNVCFRKSSWDHPGVHAGKEHCLRL